MAVDLAGKIVGENLADQQTSQRVVDRFIDSLADSTAGNVTMLGTSRASQTQLRERVEALYEDPTQRPFLADAGTGVLAVIDAADRERSLRDLWADTATVDTVKEGAAAVFNDRISTLAQQVVGGVITSRWSSPTDAAMDALERPAPRCFRGGRG